MLSALIAAAMLAQCPGGYCPAPPAPQHAYQAPAASYYPTSRPAYAPQYVYSYAYPYPTTYYPTTYYPYGYTYPAYAYPAYYYAYPSACVGGACPVR